MRYKAVSDRHLKLMEIVAPLAAVVAPRTGKRFASLSPAEITLLEHLREEVLLLREALARSEHTVARQQELLNNARTRELELRQQLVEGRS